MVDVSTVIFLSYVLFAVIIIYTLLFGESEFHRSGIVGMNPQTFVSPIIVLGHF